MTYRVFLVLEAGLEPAQPQWPRDFKSLVSTDSTIRAAFQRRAENETRTRDPNLGKVMLYQLSYFRIFLTGANVGSFTIHSKHLHRFLYFILFLRVLFRLFRLFQNQIRLLLDSLIAQFCHCKDSRYFRRGCGVLACRK